jgi:hemerythrin
MVTLWKNDYLLNLDEIDAQHKRFFDMLDEAKTVTDRASLTEADVHAVFKFLLDFRTYGYQHFYTEEKFMIRKNFPDVLNHLDSHDEFISTLNGYRSEFLTLFKSFKGGKDNREEIKSFITKVIQYIAGWYEQHIIREDTQYAVFVKRK